MTGRPRLVFELSDAIARDGTRMVEIALREPRVPGTPRQEFPYRGDEPIFLGLAAVPPAADALRSVGRALFEAVTEHPPLSDTFAEALRTHDRYPLFVQIDSSSSVESLPWETLCTDDGVFLGLDERWSIGRIVDPGRAPAASCDLQLPLRIAAVLSALGVPAAPEWESLRDSVAAAGLPVDLLVLASEDELAGAIAATPPPAGVTITVERVPATTEALQERIRAFDPHVLHFFCHGSAQGHAPYVQVAVSSDWVSDTKHSLYLETSQFRDLTERTSDRPWLLVLNCCETAASGRGESLQSLALRLVRDAALPAVVGMREPVSSTDASLFTGSFYAELLTEVAERQAGAVPADEPVNWARYAVRARTTLLDKHGLPRTTAAETTREWTLPVVYQRPDPFVVRSAAVPGGTDLPSVAPPPAIPVPVLPLPEPVPPAPAAEPAAPPGAAPAAPPAAEPVPPVRAAPAVAEADRSARLEAELLTGLLTRLPAGTPDDLVADIKARLHALGVPATEPPPAPAPAPEPVGASLAGGGG